MDAVDTVSARKLALLISFLAVCLTLALSLPAMSEASEDKNPATENAPHPYTPDQIRDFCIGRTVTHRVEQAESVHFVETRFLAGDAESGTLITRTVDPDGIVTEGPTRSPIRWADLRDHATFPAARTTVTDAICETLAGEFECMLYTVTSESPDGPVSRFYFAKKCPGAPVLFESELGGTMVYRMVLTDEVPKEKAP